ncbi:hypothetical protein ZIOFF_031743 [Zingiber officinale]|uniref:Uncharacterized protein n=1 Tax=Zingiber officinale TaxID=94328 RepID=A0A8J5L5K3_ZINOF|nr:hypothetical protein ZIOFF_031743 [Zingiber officinale]
MSEDTGRWLECIPSLLPCQRRVLRAAIHYDVCAPLYRCKRVLNSGSSQIIECLWWGFLVNQAHCCKRVSMVVQ